MSYFAEVKDNKVEFNKAGVAFGIAIVVVLSVVLYIKMYDMDAPFVKDNNSSKFVSGSGIALRSSCRSDGDRDNCGSSFANGHKKSHFLNARGNGVGTGPSSQETIDYWAGAVNDGSETFSDNTIDDTLAIAARG